MIQIFFYFPVPSLAAHYSMRDGISASRPRASVGYRAWLIMLSRRLCALGSASRYIAMCGRWNKSAFQLGEIISMHALCIVLFKHRPPCRDTTLIYGPTGIFAIFSRLPQDLNYLCCETHWETTLDPLTFNCLPKT